VIGRSIIFKVSMSGLVAEGFCAFQCIGVAA
jgi:hypothetical protein